MFIKSTQSSLPTDSLKKLSFLLSYLGKWFFLALLVGALSGSASALFLHALDWTTQTRESNYWLLMLLPVGGLLIGLTYHYFGESVVKGNNLIIENYHVPKKLIPFKMTPMVLFGTLITHLFGGSAGREGTAVQMGGAIADQFSLLKFLKQDDRKLLLIMGVSAGFASVFGTPLAGAVFALEVMALGQMRFSAIVPSFFAAIIAHYICLIWNVQHTHYVISSVPDLNLFHILLSIAAGIVFGLAAFLFAQANHLFSKGFSQRIKYPPFRPLFGGLVLSLIVLFSGSTRYLGLGIPIIQEAFTQSALPYDFILKLLFTAFTLGAGFKGGEVTPLFFIGATLGNALAWMLPLPMSLLAGMGFVAVFAGATNTPIACILMGIELFGIESGIYIGLACVSAYLFSGHRGIYSAQTLHTPKHPLNKKDSDNLNPT